MSRKCIFITGGASGIGRAVAEKFAAEGWFIGIADINEAGMRETAALLPAGQSSIHTLDVRDRAAWDVALADCAKASGGRIDVMFNNAGIPLGGPLANNTTAEIERCLDINLKGVLFGAQAAYPYLKAAAPGSALLNTASAAGIYGGANISVYGATKFGVRCLTEALDAEWFPDGIKVASLMPSFIDTPLLKHTSGQNTNQDIRTQVLEAGLELTSAGEVADIAWNAVHGDKVHNVVGKTAKRMAFVTRWLPGAMRKQSRTRLLAVGGDQH